MIFRSDLKVLSVLHSGKNLALYLNISFLVSHAG